MRGRKRLCGVLMIIAALVIMQLPVTEADAATSASDFEMEGMALLKYRGTETNVTIPSTVEEIGGSAFEGNKTVELVVVPNSVKKIGSYAFWGCDNLDTVVLGRGLTEVGDYAFTNCQGLEQMAIPANVTRIGISAFKNCVNLTDITIPSEVTYIHESAFDGCYKLQFHCEEGSYGATFAQAFYEKQQERPEYEDVSKYTPSTPEDTEGAVDGDVGGEGSDTVPDTYIPEGKELGLTHVVGNQAVVFLDNTSPQVLGGMPMQVEGESIPAPSVEPVTGDGGEGIAKYTIVDEHIVADQAYYRAEGLETITLPEETEEIGQFAFARSTVSKVLIPEGTREIGYGAFYHCDNLTAVELPSTLVCVEPKAFAYTPWVERFLSGAEGSGDFLISGGVLVAYRGTGEYVEIPEGVTLIAAEAFQGHGEIVGVALPESLRIVGEGAFENCGGLSNVTYGSGLTDLKDRAFAGTALTQASLPPSLERIGLQVYPESAQVIYGGDAPEATHEISAQRLSNEAYRQALPGDGQPGVTAVGAEGVNAWLEGADRSYFLTVSDAGDGTREAMAQAFRRNLGQEMPQNILLYELTLTDGGSIPINKTGTRYLTVELPVPEQFAQTGLRMVLLDRNGQLESLPLARMLVDGRDCIRFSTRYLSAVGIFEDGSALDPGELTEVTAEFNNMAAPRASVSPGPGAGVVAQWILGSGLLLCGLIFLIHKRA